MAKEKLAMASPDPVSDGDVEAGVKEGGASAKDPGSADKGVADAAGTASTKTESKGSVSKADEPVDQGAASGIAQGAKSAEVKEPSATGETDKAGNTASAAEGSEPAKDKDTVEEEDAPPRPVRPVSPGSQMKKDLMEAFPDIEEKYIVAFLIASEGRMDPAFNALLSLSDPTYKPEPVAYSKPPPIKREKSTLTDDEILARQLQKEFDREERRRRSEAQRQRSRKHAPVAEDSDSDEFGQIKEQFSQGFEEAKATIGGWVSGLAKKFNQDDEEDSSAKGGSSQKQNPKLFGALGGSSFKANQKDRSKRFDEDPEILSSDFSRNVNLNENDAPKLPKRKENTEKDGKWQPLNSDVPVNPDAFLVTDSEEEDKTY